MNRTGMGLAVGAGYLLGRTRKLKLAIAVGTLAAGRKLNLTPKGVAELVSTQLRENPQFKEIGDQLRTDLRGVGSAASGALVERQIDGLADRLHGRTADLRDQLSGAVPEATDGEPEDTEDTEDTEGAEETEGADEPRDAEEPEGAEESEEPEEPEEPEESEEPEASEDTGEPEGGTEPEAPAEHKRGERRASRGDREARRASSRARRTDEKAPTRKATVRKTAAKKARLAGKAAGERTESVSAPRATRTRPPKGGGER
ncbi:DNA primase [Streptomyces tagetis]|uniref:DNA primase n=1 Tax=Streptomyces tagetis TaxID=2820809 RepID=A0A940XBZ3_9ACTN|nr:DNA primase [Streptomyces sp. RG38]MBQ0825615.1 DNA primase [Streptomyces sp. RG38]